MSQIPIEKQVFDKNTFGRVINTQFSQLLNNVTEETPEFTIDDFFEQTIIFETVQTGIVKSKDIVLDLNFNYMDKTTSFVFKGKVVEVETHGSSNYIIIEISSQNASDFYAFMKLYNTRQENINFFLNAAKG